MARPRKKLTDDQIKELETLAPFLTAEQLADYFMIARSTFYHILDNNPEINGRYKRAKSKAVAMVAKNLVKQAIDGDKVAAMFYLKTQAGWRETTHLDHTSTDGSVTMPNVIKIVPGGNEKD